MSLRSRPREGTGTDAFANPSIRQRIMHSTIPTPRPIGAINAVGLWTLYRKEVRRFLKVFTQTAAAPVVTTLLVYVVFSMALGRVVRTTGDVPYLVFLAPGLIMMTMMQNAFANTSSSILIAKHHGNIVDVLMTPLTSHELAIGYALGGVTRGLLVGLVTWVALRLFVPIDPVAIGWVLFHAVAGSLMLSLLGIVGGIWSDRFEKIGALTNFVITPFTFLSGTFYSVDRLPEGWQFVAHLNPFFFLIDGFRYGFIGQSDSNLLLGAAVVALVDLALFLLVWRLFAVGYKLKP